jgi:pimeloyl-ACP methyl ester carboxylesterase
MASLNVPYRGWCCGFPTLQYIREHLAERFGYVLAFQEEGAMEAVFEADPEGWLRRFYSFPAGRTDFLTDDEFGVFLAAFTTTGIRGPLNYYRNLDANWHHVAPHADAPISVPVLMVAADSDPVLPLSLVSGMERWVPDLSIVTIPDCGHWTQQEQPAAVNEALIDFLDSLAP